MGLYKLLYVLYKIRLLSPLALLSLAKVIYKDGINLFALLHFSAKNNGERIALTDEQETLTYRQLYEQCELLSLSLLQTYGLKQGMKVGLMCKNHASLVKSLYAVSATGADIYLLNAEMGDLQLTGVLDQQQFDLIVIDEERYEGVKLALAGSKQTIEVLLSYHDTRPAINNIALNIKVEVANIKRRRGSTGRLVLFTGGTTGQAKQASHKPSLFNYLNPFYAFIKRLNIVSYSSAYIATPIYHGYGVAVLLLFHALGKRVFIRRAFLAEAACKLIQRYNIEVITVVPLMLQRLLKHDAAALKSLTCIASGGAELSPVLVEETFSKLGKVLYNLYGTSEAGLNIIATPDDLSYSPLTIGTKISGVKLRILDEQRKEASPGHIGQLCIKNGWSIKNIAPTWLETGDLAYQDEQGYFFLRGRVDSMIVSAGENVYPLEVEHVLLTHPQVEDACVIGIEDEQFGQRLKAFVVMSAYSDVKVEELQAWLRLRLARFQLPKEIVFVKAIPYTALGKQDKKQLK